MVTSALWLLLGMKAMTNPDSVLKSKDITLSTKVQIVKAMVFLVIMYRCESWTIKKGEHRRIDAFQLVLEKTLESPLDSKEIKPINPRGNQPWIFTGRTDAEAEAPILWPPVGKHWLTDAGKHFQMTFWKDCTKLYTLMSYKQLSSSDTMARTMC